MIARRAGNVAADLDERAIEVDGLRRTYRVAPARSEAPDRSPVLIVLHGAGGSALGMAGFTRLAERGPTAGFTVVFPDGVGGVWNDNRAAPGLRRREGVDDVVFLQRLGAEVTGPGQALFLAGMSNGAFMAEHVARHGLLAVRGIALVAGSATERSLESQPRPTAPCAVLAFAGTADPLVPYYGGPIGPVRRPAAPRGPRLGRTAARGVAVAIETVAAEWAAVNGLPATPAVQRTPAEPGDLAVTRVAWEAPGDPPVVLYRVEGGGHAWPGGAQYLPARLVGPVVRHLDATGIILTAFSAAALR